MNEQVRRTLYKLINQHGPSLCDDPPRCKGLLRDLCPEHKLEVKVLSLALEERIPAEFRRNSNSLPKEAQLAQLTQRLYQENGLERDVARWAVESWAVALGWMSPDEITGAQTAPSAQRSTAQTPTRGGVSRSSPPPPPGVSRPGAGSATTSVAVPPPAHGSRQSLIFVLAAAGGALLLLVMLGAVALFKWGSGPEGNVNSPPGMVYVPGGEFIMGSDTGDELERPAHTERVGAFFIDKHEVSCAEYARFLQENSHHKLPDGWQGRQCPPGLERRPVAGVDWLDATAYASWAGKRLPTEAEWELAARGTDRRRYPWGDEWKPEAANVGEALGHTSNVGQYPAGESPFKALDMVGNVWEWTVSDLTTYSGRPLPPTISRNGATSEVTFGKVIRGGSWLDDPRDATTTMRRGYPPQGSDIDYANTGFRCVKDVAAAK